MDNTAPVVVEPIAATRWPEWSPGLTQLQPGVGEAVLPPQTAAEVGPAEQPLPRLSFQTSLITLPSSVTAAGLLLEVRARLDVSGAEPSAVAVEFTAPGGQVFDRQELRLTGTVFERQTLQFAMPVAGTLIDSSRIVGTWRARFFLGGVDIGAEQFEVTP